MSKGEYLYIESKSSSMNLALRNIELLILLGAFFISLMLTVVTVLGYFSFLLFSLSVFVVGVKRGSFINSGLEYFVFKSHIDLYRDGKLYRSYDLHDSSVLIERTLFGTNIVFKKSISKYFESDSVFGFANDLGKRSYEFLIYNCSEHEKVLDFINS